MSQEPNTFELSAEVGEVEVVLPGRKVEYTVLAALVALAGAIARVKFPDFPYTDDSLFALALYVLLKLGVEVVNPPIQSFLARFK